MNEPTIEMGNVVLRALGVGEPETFRCRVYGSDDVERSHEKKVAFLRQLATVGVVDAPAYDPWVEALQGRGWLPESPELEPNPDGPGRIGRWRFTELGMQAWEDMQRPARAPR